MQISDTKQKSINSLFLIVPADGKLLGVSDGCFLLARGI